MRATKRSRSMTVGMVTLCSTLLLAACSSDSSNGDSGGGAGGIGNEGGGAGKTSASAGGSDAGSSAGTTSLPNGGLPGTSGGMGGPGGAPAGGGASQGKVDLRGAPAFVALAFTDPRGPGYPCAQDSDCDSGACRAYGDADPTYKFCTMSCDAHEDCEPLLDNGVLARVPLQYETFSGTTTNNWNSEVLYQFPYCDSETNTCSFVCPVFSAAKFDSEGTLTSCSCLPGFTKGGDAAQHCVWDSALGCSLVSDPSTGKPAHECNEERAMGGLDICPDVAKPTCAMYDDGTFEGACLWWTTNIDACVSSAPANCNDACLEQCYFSTGADSCYQLCCQ